MVSMTRFLKLESVLNKPEAFEKMLKMISKVVVFALLLLTAFHVSAAPNYIVVGYCPGYSDPSNPSYNFPANFATGIPWGDFSHVNYAFVTVGTTVAGMDDANAMAAALCNQAHANHVRCYLTVGGANGNTWPTTTGNAQTLANSITSLIHYQGVTFDGIDLDWEFPTNASVFDALVKQIRTNLNALTPGYPMSGKYPDESSMGFTMYLSPGSSVCGYDFATTNQYIDWYTDSGYDLNVGTTTGGGDQWNGALIDPTDYLFTNCLTDQMQLSIETVSNWYESNGTAAGTIPFNKMVLGMPFYGRNQGGTADVSDAVQLTGTGSGYNTTACEELYSGYSMDVAQSFCDKMNWAIGQQGMQGIAIWNLAMGLPTTASSGMTAIWNVVAGNSSCLTITTGCTGCTATPTPTFTPGCGTLVDNFESGSAQNQLGGYVSTSGGCTVNPTSFLPSAGYGLDGSTYGGRFYGSTTGCTYGPELLCALQPTGSTNYYNANTKGQNAVQFSLKVTTGNTSGPSTIYFGAEVGVCQSGDYQTTVVVPSASVGQQLHFTVFFSQLPLNYTSCTPALPATLDTTQLFQLYWEPAWTGNYDITVDNIYFTCAPTPTPTPTITKTSTPTSTITFTNTPTPSKTPTSSPTNSPTPTPSNTPTPSPTFTVALTSTFTATITPTKTSTPSPTNSQTPVSTPTPTWTTTTTNTPTSTLTKTSTPTLTNTITPPNTSTFTPTSTNTATKTATSTSTNTFTPTITFTPTNSLTPTNTPTITLTPLFSYTPTDTFTITFTPTKTLTFTATSTLTSTQSPTSTATSTPSLTNTYTPLFTNTPTDTPLFTSTPTSTPLLTNTPTNTLTTTSTATSTYTPIFSSTPTTTPTVTGTPTFTLSPTTTATSTLTSTFTNTPTNSPTPLPPVISSVNPPSGLTTGGYAVTITGSNFNSTPAVTFGGTNASISTFNSTTIIVTVPAGSAGSVPVIVTVGTQTSNSNTFIYLVPTATATPTFTSTLTSTATNTMTPTSTLTATSTPVVTRTFTPTATATPVNQVIFGSPYPNPIMTGTLKIDVTTPSGNGTITMDVFTIAFRKIVDHSFGIANGSVPGSTGNTTTIQWDLKDKFNVPAADGLYYVRVHVVGGSGSGIPETVKIFKVLILK